MPASLHRPIETEWRKAQTLALLAEYKARPCVAARNQIIELNRGLIRKVALKYVERCPESYEDLVQIGVPGLILAIEQFQCDKGVAFSSYAIPSIRGAILHWLRDKWSHLKTPRRWGEDYDRVAKIRRTLAARGREVADERIALSLGINAVQWRQITEAMQRKPFVDLDDVHAIPTDNEIEIDEQRLALKQQLLSEVARLPALTGDCVMARYFDGHADEQIARRHRISAAEVAELINQALTTIKNRLEPA